MKCILCGEEIKEMGILVKGKPVCQACFDLIASYKDKAPTYVPYTPYKPWWEKPCIWTTTDGITKDKNNYKVWYTSYKTAHALGAV